MKIIGKPTIVGALAASALVVAMPVSAQQSPLANQSRTPVQFAQILQPGEIVALGENAAEVASRSYYQRVSANELSSGVDIITQAPGAVIRLTPVDAAGPATGKSNAKLRVADLEISRGGENPVALERSGALIADQEQLAANQPDLFENTLAFTTPDGMGAGRFTLRSNQKLAKGQDYVVHVFDKASNEDLIVSSPRQHVFTNGAVNGAVSLSAGALKRNADIEAYLAGPNGQRIDLQAVQNGEALVFSGDIPETLSLRPGELWRTVIRYREKGGAAPLYRDAELPLAVGESTASFKGVASSENGLSINASVSKAGRYEVRAWVFGRHDDLAEAPAMLAFAAAWLEPGDHEIAVSLDREQLAAAGFARPYTAKQVQLIDQSRLMVLETVTISKQINTAQ